MSQSKSVPIDAAVVLQEDAALIEHYRNRGLLLAQAVAEARQRISVLEAELAEVKAALQGKASVGAVDALTATVMAQEAALAGAAAERET